MTQETIDKINLFTRRPMSEEEIFTFSVILCDNDIDRDGECFSDNALAQLAEKFVGKTGISDHNPTASNQNARIFETELVTDDTRLTKYGVPYKYLKASAYMVRTTENATLIAEIDGGIKKEVSISCIASKKICSVCGCNKSAVRCQHVKSQKYGNKLCYTVLDDVTDAYEWSFVAIPAQVNAGVTKRFQSGDNAVFSGGEISVADEEIKRDIRKFAFFTGGKQTAERAMVLAEFMNTSQLIELKKSFEERMRNTGTEVQIIPEEDFNFSAEDFSVR